MPIVRILQAVAGLDFSWLPNERVVLTAAEAEAWCDGERAVLVGPTPAEVDDELAQLRADELAELVAADEGPVDELAGQLGEVLVEVHTVGESGPEVLVVGPGEVVEGPGVPFKPLPEAVEGDDTERVSEPDYGALTANQLRELLGVRRLDTTGRKPELLARLVAADQAEDDSTT